MFTHLAFFHLRLCISQFHLRPASPGYCGAFARLVSPGGGAFASFALLGGRAFSNPGAIPELLTRRQFPIRIQLHRRFYWKKADWFICQG